MPDQATGKITLNNVWATYGENVVLRDIFFDVNPAEIACIIGASGCGKTTLLNVIAGLVPYSKGTVAINHEPVTHPGPDRVVVFQEDAVFPWLTVRRNIEYGLRLKGLSRKEREPIVSRVLELVGLTGSQNVYPRELSGGMRKRVDLARALAVEPETLLMDEPYAALDAMTKERLQVEFLRIHEEAPMTVLFVTHDLEEALFLGDRVSTMGVNSGRIHSTLDVPFPRPRPVELKRSEEFQRLRGELAERLEATGSLRGDDLGQKDATT